MTESEIIARCKANDYISQEVLYKRYADKMLRLAMRYIRIQAEAEDVIVMTFTKIFKYIKDFNDNGQGSLEAWMRKIVVNESLMCLRKHHNFNLTESIDDISQEPDIESMSTLEAEDILIMISQLPTGYRTVFNLYVIEGFEHHEIAQLLGITEGTSRSQLFKAKSLLKKMLTQEGYSYGT